MLIIGIQNFAQNGVAINNTGAEADSSAILDLSSTDKGFLPPRLTEAQRDNIANPAVGLMLWCSDCGTAGELQVFTVATWTNLAVASTPPPSSCVNPLVDARDG
jgi:hypothetical protein